MSRLIQSSTRIGRNAIAGPSRVPLPRAVMSPSVSRQWAHSSRTDSRPPQARYNSTSPPKSKPTSQTAWVHQPHPSVKNLFNTLSTIQPCFATRGDEITLLNSPQEFYSALLAMIKRAKRRITISSLYIGVEETELVEALRQALTSNPQLRLAVIMDYHRSTRFTPSEKYPASTAHLLLPLIQQFPDRCEVWFFRSPKLRGVMEKIVPARFDEGWGTWHAKWYGVDDEVILSGANLASSYFTNRQDRYIHFHSHPTLLSYLTSLARLFEHYSYLLSASPPPSISPHHLVPLLQPKSGSNKSSTSSSISFTKFNPVTKAALVWPTPSVHPRNFSQHALATLSAFQNSWRASNPSRLKRVDVDTWFWPVVQAGVLGIKEEERALGKLWEAVDEGHQAIAVEEKKSHSVQIDEANVEPKKAEERSTVPPGLEVDLTSGYFGLYKSYKKAIINSTAPVRIIAASPKANGFYGSKGLSRLIPEGYTLLESRFEREARRQGRSWDSEKVSGVRLKEWEKEGWTYHAKGIWLSPPSQNPTATFLGSSNLSTRSITLDTELSLLVVTSSPSLRKALGIEIKALDEYTKDVDEETWKSEERKVSWLAWLLVALGVEGML